MCELADGVAARGRCAVQQLGLFAWEVGCVFGPDDPVLANLVQLYSCPPVCRVGHDTQFAAAVEQGLDAHPPVGLKRD